MADQFSLFGSGWAEPRIADLEGLLAGPGQLVRRGAAARLSNIVDAPWRAAALLAAFGDRSIAGERVVEDGSPVPPGDSPAASGSSLSLGDSPAASGSSLVVRTEFLDELGGLAGQWVRGAVKRPPPGFRPSSGQLRLWTMGAGRGHGEHYLLGLAPSDSAAWPQIVAALRSAGIAASVVGARSGAPACRVSGRPRLRRLAALVGEPPPDAPSGDWPA